MDEQVTLPAERAAGPEGRLLHRCRWARCSVAVMLVVLLSGCTSPETAPPGTPAPAPGADASQGAAAPAPSPSVDPDDPAPRGLVPDDARSVEVQVAVSDTQTTVGVSYRLDRAVPDVAGALEARLDGVGWEVVDRSDGARIVELDLVSDLGEVLRVTVVDEDGSTVVRAVYRTT